MMRMHRRVSGAVTVLLLTALILTGCTSEASNIGVAKDKKENVVDSGFKVSTVGSFDSADTAVVLSTDMTNKAVSFINMDTGKQYTLYYDGTTYVKDKHDGPMTISQVKAGDVVDITFLKGKKKLASIKRSPEAWVYDDVRNYDLAGANKTASIGSLTYSLPSSVVVLSEGRRMGSEEVVSQDVVTISGIDHKIYSVNVDRGHGYLRLKNDQPLLGGWIEVGNSVIRQITEDMLLTVPEGSYQVVLSNNGVGCVKEVTVERDKEFVLDVGDIEIAEDKTGKILFSVTPETAKVSVDGKPVDISGAVEMRYGIHQVVVEASGYDTLSKYIQVGSEYATISFTLEESRKSDNDKNSLSENSAERIPWQDTLSSISGNSISGNSLSTLSENALTTSNNNKVYIDSPKGVEVYLDGNYVGLAPVRFTKSPGRHEITLRKSGYKTKTYSIYLDSTQRDETYSFSDLEKEGSDNSGSSGGDSNDGDNNPSGGGTTGEPQQLPGQVKFDVTPNNATVKVDGKPVEDISKAVTLTCGSHTVHIEANGYKSYDGSITVVSGAVESGVQTKPFKLTKIVEVTFRIEPSDASITKIVVDNDTYSSVPETIELSCEKHTVKVEAADYEVWGPKEIEISEGNSTIDISLEKSSKEIQFHINGIIKDEDKDKIEIKVGDKGTVKLGNKIKLPYGTYLLTVNGYTCSPSDITVDSGTKTEFPIELKKIE